MGYPFLRDIALSKDSVDVAEFGLKTDGLIELIRDIPLFRSRGFRYSVPPGFVIPLSADLDSLRSSYDSLVRSWRRMGALVVRSSHPEELPGLYETIPVLINPADHTESYRDFAAAVERVREQPRKAVIVQPLIGKLEVSEMARGTIIEVPVFDDTFDFAAAEEAVLDARYRSHSNDTEYVLIDGDTIRGGTLSALDFLRAKRGDVLRYVAEEMRARSDGSPRPAADRGRELSVKITGSIIPVDRAIGVSNTSFVGRSESYFDHRDVALTACRGLPTKLVGQPEQYAVVLSGPDGLRVFSAGCDYDETWRDYQQETLDVFSVSERRVIAIPSENRLPMRQLKGRFVPSGIDETARPLIELLQHYQNRHGRPMEIEGTISGGRTHLLQLTKSYHLDERPLTLTELTDKHEILSASPCLTVGSLHFSGTIVSYAGKADNPRGRAALTATLESMDPDKTLVVTEQFCDEVLAQRFRNYVIASNEHGIVRSYMKRSYHVEILAHAVAFMQSQVYARRRRGDNVCYLSEPVQLDGKFLRVGSARRYSDSFGLFVVDATFEAAQNKFQIFR